MRAHWLALGAAGAAVAAGLAWWVAQALVPATFPAVALAASRPQPQGDFLLGVFVEPTHFNPFTNVDPAVRTWVLRLTHDTLCDIDPRSGAVRMTLAESIEQGDDRSLRIRLREGVRFADGSELRADDVVFSHACACTPGLPVTAAVRAARMVESVSATGPRELLVQGLAPVWMARDVFTTGLVVVSRAGVQRAIEAVARRHGLPVPAPSTPDFARALGQLAEVGPGSGPYMLARAEDGEVLWQRGRHLDLVQNPHSWWRRDLPDAWNLAGFRHLFVNDPVAQVALAREQSLDWLVHEPRALLASEETVRKNYRLVTYDSPQLGHVMVMWNCRQAPLSDARVRRALAKLFDRAAIAERVFEGAATPAKSWFKPGMREVPPDVELPPHDVAAAVTELQAAGFGGPGQPRLRVALLAASAEVLHRRILELAQSAFAAAGVELHADGVEAASFRERIVRGEFQGALAVKYHQDPWIDPWPFFHGSQAVQGGQNWMGFVDAEVDRLLDGAREELDADKRVELHRAFGRRLHELQPVALLVHPLTSMLLHQRFQNVEPGVGGLSPEAWFVPVDQQLHGRR